MKTIAILVAIIVAAAGCAGGVGGTHDEPTTSECCVLGAGQAATCAGPQTIVQWDNRTWSDRPDEVAADGECATGHTCTVYRPVTGGFDVVGTGVCP